MKNRKNIRTCIGCRKREDKQNYIRVYFNKENKKLEIDETHKLGSRGIYLCKNKECIKKAIKKNQIRKNLKLKKIYIDENEIKNIFDNYEI